MTELNSCCKQVAFPCPSCVIIVFVSMQLYRHGGGWDMSAACPPISSQELPSDAHLRARERGYDRKRHGGASWKKT